MLLAPPFFRPFSRLRFLVVFWSLLGSLLTALWHPLGSFWHPSGSYWDPFGTLLAHIGTLLVPFRARFWLFCTLGVSFWFVLGEIHFLRQYFAKKYTCIDLASNFLQIFRMQIIFPRPGGGTIAAGNRDSPPGRAQPARGAC